MNMRDDKLKSLLSSKRTWRSTTFWIYITGCKYKSCRGRM